MTILKQNRFIELDALRGLAALGVVLFHFTTWYSNKFTLNIHPYFLFPLGYCGVHLFFIISGFVIFMTLEKTKKPFDFVVSRFSRLYPAYWTVLLINIFLVSDLGLKRFFFNFTMAEAWFNSQYIVPAFWTLTVELSFYAVMLLLFTTKNLKHIEELGLLWISIMMLNARMGPILHFHWPWLIEKSLLLNHGNLFFAGILFYKIKYEGNTIKRQIALLLCWLTQFLVAREFFPTPVMVALFFMIFYLFCFDKIGFLKNKWIVFFGTISYSFYLIHENLGIKILLFFDAIRINYWLSFLAAMACSIAAAACITVFIEKPALKFIREKIFQKTGK